MHPHRKAWSARLFSHLFHDLDLVRVMQCSFGVSRQETPKSSFSFSGDGQTWMFLAFRLFSVLFPDAVRRTRTALVCSLTSPGSWSSDALRQTNPSRGEQLTMSVTTLRSLLRARGINLTTRRVCLKVPSPPRPVPANLVLPGAYASS